MDINIGIEKDDRVAIAEGVSKVLANSYALYLMTQNFHWNVTGSMFNVVHTMTEDQYNELASAIDELAERIRALGVRAPATFSEFQELACNCLEEPKKDLDAEDMVRKLVKGNEAIARTAREVIPLTDKANDEATADLLTQRIQLHEKNAWMLRSLLAK